MAVSAVKKESESAAAGADKQATPAKPGKSKKMLLIALIALVVIGAGGGGAYWYSTRGHASAPEHAKSEPAKPPVFISLETFTVNLQLEENPQFLQVGLSLKVKDAEVIEALKLYMPEVRNRILLLLSSRKASALLTVEGKQKLSVDIVTAINAVLAPAGKTPAPAGAAPAEHAAAGGTDTAKADAPEAPAAEEKPAPDAPAAAGEDATAAVAPTLPVLGVMFTSFIIQ
jgi:flagellar FliL protein